MSEKNYEEIERKIPEVTDDEHMTNILMLLLSTAFKQKQLNEIPKNEEQSKRPVGRPKKTSQQPQKKQVKNNYIVRYNGVTKECKSMREISEFTGKSQTCLFRILDNKNVYKKKTSQHLKDIHIERILPKINI